MALTYWHILAHSNEMEETPPYLSTYQMMILDLMVIDHSTIQYIDSTRLIQNILYKYVYPGHALPGGQSRRSIKNFNRNASATEEHIYTYPWIVCFESF